MKKLLITSAILFFFLFSISVSADFTLADWKLKKHVEIPSLDHASYIKVKVDSEMFAGSNDLRDIRVIDTAHNNEIPYQIVVKQASTENAYRAAEIYDKSVVDGKTIFILDVGKDALLHNQLHIDTNSYNYKRQVSIYTSDSLLPVLNSNWRLLTDTGYMYNFNDTVANFNAGSGDVEYPKTTSRYIKVVIDSGTGGPIVVTGASVYKNITTNEEDTTISLPLLIAQNSKEKTTELIIDKTVSGIPSHGVELSSPDLNFSRRVVVQSSNNRDSWTLVSQGYIFSINTELFNGSQMTVDFGETTDRYIRVIVFNDDNQPVHFDITATIKTIVRNIIFQADPHATYDVYYSNPNAHIAHYDLDRIFPYIEAQSLPTATFSTEEQNQNYLPPKPAPIPLTERIPHLIDAVLIFFTMLIGLLIFSYVHKIQRLS